eukprot:2553462-Rhodomonas_salina.1
MCIRDRSHTLAQIDVLAELCIAARPSVWGGGVGMAQREIKWAVVKAFDLALSISGLGWRGVLAVALDLVASYASLVPGIA